MPKNSHNKNYRTGMADRVRAAAGTLSHRKWFSIKELLDAVKTRSRKEDTSFMRCWRDMYVRGEFVRLGQAKYRYVSENTPRSHVRNRICRAMHVKGVFCAADIVKLSGGELSYVHATIRRMVNAGDLEFTGCRRKVKYFRVRNSEKFYLEFIREGS